MDCETRRGAPGFSRRLVEASQGRRHAGDGLV